ncbi:MAG: hypothetical protein AAGA21_11645 [Pseudomonadota bacterium]
MYQLIALTLIVLLTTPGSAHAYIDPGVASIILQSLVAVIATVSATVGLFWHRVKSFFRFGSSDSDATKRPAETAD